MIGEWSVDGIGMILPAGPWHGWVVTLLERSVSVVLLMAAHYSQVIHQCTDKSESLKPPCSYYCTQLLINCTADKCITLIPPPCYWQKDTAPGRPPLSKKSKLLLLYIISVHSDIFGYIARSLSHIWLWNSLCPPASIIWLYSWYPILQYDRVDLDVNDIDKTFNGYIAINIARDHLESQTENVWRCFYRVCRQTWPITNGSSILMVSEQKS